MSRDRSGEDESGAMGRRRTHGERGGRNGNMGEAVCLKRPERGAEQAVYSTGGRSLPEVIFHVKQIHSCKRFPR